MAELEIYDHSKKKIETINLDDSVFQADINEVLLHQIMVAYEANKRQGTHKTKCRSEIKGTTKKAYRQKGTGRARMGAAGKVAHHRGGAAQFGPTPRSYRKGITKKMRQEAFRQCLSLKYKKNQLHILSDLDFKEIKTRQAASILDSFESNGRVLFVDQKFSDQAALSIRNLHKVNMEETGSCSPIDIFKVDHVFLTKAAVEELQTRYAKAGGQSNAA